MLSTILVAKFGHWLQTLGATAAPAAKGAIAALLKWMQSPPSDEVAKTLERVPDDASPEQIITAVNVALNVNASTRTAGRGGDINITGGAGGAATGPGATGGAGGSVSISGGAIKGGDAGNG